MHCFLPFYRCFLWFSCLRCRVSADLIAHIRKSFSCDGLSLFVWADDFNLPEIDWTLKSAFSSHCSDFLLSVKEFSQKQLASLPTRKQNILDLFCVPTVLFTEAPFLISPACFVQRSRRCAVYFRCAAYADISCEEIFPGYR